MTPGCLSGVRILELARYQAGPRGGMIMGDLGAEVIKIEQPGGEETRRYPPVVGEQSIYFSAYNRGKKSVCIDMHSDEGKQIFSDLVRKADIVLENFRPGTINAMGFGYENLRSINPGIILVSISGFGQYGPYSDRPAFDSIGQAMSGLMALTGQPLGQPVGTAFSVVDRITALHATIGALSALRHRERTGEGQVVDVCLMDAALTTVEIPMAYFLATGSEGGESGRLPYRTKDGWVVIQAGSRQMTARMVKLIMGSSESTEEAGPISSAMEKTDSRRAAIEDWCATRSTEEICAALIELGIPVAPVKNIPDVVKDPHLWERDMLVKADDSENGMFVPGVSVKLSKTPGEVGPVPRAGEHTDQVLSELLAYDSDLVAKLRHDRIIA